MAMPIDVQAVVDMAADMDIEALLEKQVGGLGMLMTALGRPKHMWLRSSVLDGSLYGHDVLTCGPALPWTSVLGMTSTRKLTV